MQYEEVCGVGALKGPVGLDPAPPVNRKSSREDKRQVLTCLPPRFPLVNIRDGLRCKPTSEKRGESRIDRQAGKL